MFSLVAALSACGSTVQLHGAANLPSGADGGAGGLTATTGASPSGAIDGTTGAASGLGGSTGGSTTGSTGLPGGASSGGSTGTGGTSGSGTTGSVLGAGKPIRLGVVVPDASALLAAFGASGPSDIFAAWKAQIAYLNGHGGIAGHKIEAVYVKEDATAQDGSTANQAACTSVTQDHKVDVVVSAGMVSGVFTSCLKRYGLSTFDTSPWLPDAVDMANQSNLFAIDGMRVDRYARAMVKVSVARGTLKSGDTLGVLTEDCPWGPRTYNNVVAPLAKSYGVKTVMGTFTCVTSLSGQQVAQGSSEAQQAALKFRSEGVTHVMVLSGSEGFVTVQFQTNASNQQYHPKYLITTNAFPYNNGRRDGAVMFASDALPNMSGIGFKPLIDVGDAARPANAAQKAKQSQCQAMDPAMGGAKADTGKTHYQSMDTFYVICDQMLNLKSVLETDGVKFDLASLTRGFEEVLGQIVGAAVATGSYAPAGNRTDGLGQVQPFSWNGQSEHFVYTGQHFPVD